LADRFPQPFQLVEAAGYRLLSPGGVLYQNREVGLQLLEGLAPSVVSEIHVTFTGDVTSVDDHTPGSDLGRGVTGVLEDLAAGDPHPVVVGADVDQIGRVDVDRNGGFGQLAGVGSGG